MVYHILKDGSTSTDITGHVVRVKDSESLYQLIHKISCKKSKVERPNRRGNRIKKKEVLTLCQN